MLREIAESLFTPCPAPWRRLGYLRESIAIEARARRLRRAWAPHLEHCQRIAQESFLTLPKGGTAWVLGSGGVHDVPVRALCAHFSKVYLVDMLQPRSLKKHLRAHPQLEFFRSDLTGLTGKVDALKSQAYKRNIPLPTPPTPVLDLPPANWVFSANLLPQLPLLLAAKARRCAYPEESIEAWSHDIMRAHLHWLDNLPATVCLISEHTRNYHNLRTGAVETYPALPPQPTLPPPDKQWLWELAPRGEISRSSRTVFEVHAYKDFNINPKTPAR